MAKKAIAVGYHHLNRAEIDGNESESEVSRDRLHVSTKVLDTIEHIPRAINTSLKSLELDCL